MKKVENTSINLRPKTHKGKNIIRAAERKYPNWDKKTWLVLGSGTLIGESGIKIFIAPLVDGVSRRSLECSSVSRWIEPDGGRNFELI